MANKIIDIRKIRDNVKLPQSNNGNWADCYTSGVSVWSPVGCLPHEELNWDKANKNMVTNGMVKYRAGDTVILYLGFATDFLVKKTNYEGHILPRSSTFTKYGLLLGNSMGLVDDTYNGDTDEWRAVFYATRSGSIRVGDRLVQIEIKKSEPPVEFRETQHLGNKDRGGYGSTDN